MRKISLCCLILFCGMGLGAVAGTTTDTAATDDFVLWNVRASYDATSWLTLFAMGENPLEQDYEINEGFPMPKNTVMAGADITF